MSRVRKAARGALAAALIAAAGVAGFAVGAWHAQPQRTTLASPSRELPSAAPPLRTPERASAKTHALPETLPNIPFRDRRGALRRFTHWRGHPLLVNFWAPWCSPCRAEIPLLERVSRAHPHDVQVIGVGVDARSAVLRYARRARIRYPLLIGLRPGMRAIRALGMVAVFPFSVFVDARGQIVTLKVGRLHAGQVRLILNRIGALDRGQIDLATARRQIAADIAHWAAHRRTRTATS